MKFYMCVSMAHCNISNRMVLFTINYITQCKRSRIANESIRLGQD